MEKTVGATTLDRIREQLGSLIDASIPQSFAQAMSALLTAMDYEDITLMRSRLVEAREAFLDVTHEAIQKRLGWPKRTRQACQEMRELLKGQLREHFDEVGKEIEARFDSMLKILTDLRDGPVKLLQEHGCEVENAEQLERDIAELQALKKGMLESWPWSDQALPPVDRDMVARSRAAISQGKGESIDDLIRRLGEPLITQGADPGRQFGCPMSK